MANALVAAQVIVICLCFFTLFVILNREMELQQKHYTYVLFGAVIYDLGMLLEMVAHGSLEVAVLAKGIECIGASVFMLSFLVMTGSICNVKIPLWGLALMLCADIFLAFVHFMNPYCHWFYKSYEMVGTGCFPHLNVELGFCGILYWVVSIGIPWAISTVLMFVTAVRSSRAAGRRWYFVMAGIYIIPLISLWIFGRGWPIWAYNPSMLLSSVFFCFFVLIVWRDQGLDVVSMAAKTALDAMDGGVVVINEVHHIMYYNQAAGNIFPGIEDHMGQGLDTLENWGTVLEFPMGSHREISLRGHTYSVTVGQIMGRRKVPGWVVLFQDMTDTYEMIDWLNEEREKAKEANAAKSAFVANVSHEFRTPMNAIIGMSELIIEESRGRKIYDMAVNIKRASLNLLDLVNKVLDFSKVENSKVELIETEYNLKELLDELENIMKISASQNGLSLKCQVDESLPAILYGDVGKIRQVLTNLLNNAIKFTRQGYVGLKLRGETRGDRADLEFSVEDTGMGIAPEDRERIFEGFEQVDRFNNKSRTGSGLGLAITKGFLDLMGGTIDLESVYGKGTRFTIRLSQKIVDDISIEEMSSVEEQTAAKHIFKAPDYQLLIVDDNRINLMVAKGMIEAYGFFIDTAGSGSEALEMVREKKYDMILMDHMMPEMDGIETTRRLRDYYAEIGFTPVVVALTANVSPGSREMYLNHGFDDYLAKPVEKMAVYQMLLDYIPENRRVFFEEEVVEAAYTEDDLAELFMEGVEARAALDSRGCTIAEYLELLELFYMEGKSKRELIRQYYEAKDWENYEILVHGLKSTASVIGALQLFGMSRGQEFASKAKDDNYISLTIAEYLEVYDNVLSEIRRVLIKKGVLEQAAGEAEERNPISAEDIMILLQEIIQLSEDFKSKEAQAKLGELMAYDLPDALAERLSQVRDKYKMYDDDGAEDMLHEIFEDMHL